MTINEMLAASNTFDLQVPLKDLVSALSIVTSVMDKKSVNPILSCVKLSVKDGNLSLIATDGSIFVRTFVGAMVKNASIDIAVDGKLLERMIKGLGSDAIGMMHLENSNELLIRVSDFELKLVMMPIEDFPALPSINALASYQILSKDLYNLIYYTEFSASTEEVRYNLNGVCLHSSGGKELCSAATDGFRLSTFQADVHGLQREFKIILPAKTVDFLNNLSSPIFENHIIEAQIGNNIVGFVSPKLLVISKLIDGVFPEYGGLIPRNNINKLSIQKGCFANAIERVAGIADEKSKAVKISISCDSLNVFAYTQSKGNAKQSISSQFFKYNGDSIEIAFQPKYLLDVLNLAKDDVEVELSFKDSTSPVLITIDKLEYGKFVVMPIRI
jgi:DNA polymerase-3 subunit beta